MYFPVNALAPISVIPSGNTISVSEWQLLNAEDGITVILLPKNLTDFNFTQSSNALDPIVVTFAGISISSSNESHELPLNILAPIVSKASGN